MKRKARWVVVGAVIVAVAVVVGLLVSTTGSHRVSGVASTSSDPHLTVAQTTTIEAGISRQLNAEVLPRLSGIAQPFESAIGSIDASTGTDTSSASRPLASVASAALKMTSLTDDDFDQLPVSALASKQRRLDPTERSAEQFALDASKPELDAYQTDLSALNSLIAAAPALSSSGDLHEAAALDSDVTLSSSTPAVVSSFVSRVRQLESPATQLLHYLEADIQGNVYDLATTGYVAVIDELQLVNAIDSDMYVIRKDATDIVEQLTALARATPVTLGAVSGQTMGRTTYRLDSSTQGQVCSGFPLDCWIMETPPGRGNENDGEWLSFWFGIANLAFGIVGLLSLIVDVASWGATVPATACLIVLQILTSVGQFYLDAERPLSSYEPPKPGLDKFVTISFDLLGVAFSVLGASALDDAIKVDGAAESVAKTTKALKPLLEEALAKTVGKSESADKLLDDSEQLFQHIAELKRAGSIAQARNVLKTIVGNVSSVVLAYNGPLKPWLRDLWKFLQTRLSRGLPAPVPSPRTLTAGSLLTRYLQGQPHPLFASDPATTGAGTFALVVFPADDHMVPAQANWPTHFALPTKVLRFWSHHWMGVASLDLPLPPGNRFSPNSVSSVDATGARTPDFLVEYQTGVNFGLVGVIVSDVTGSWAVATYAPRQQDRNSEGTFDAPVVAPPGVFSLDFSCNPNCVAAQQHLDTWKYDLAARGFVLVSRVPCGRPGQVSCTPVPLWATALGGGITIVPPGSHPSPGNGSPGGVAEANTADINAGNLTAACELLEPSAQAACTQATTGQSSSGVSYENFGLGYIAIDGDEALVGTVGTYCNPNSSPTCVTNSDPAAIFSSGQTFATLYNAAVAAAANSTPSNDYSLAPCIEIDGAWYLNAPG